MNHDEALDRLLHELRMPVVAFRSALEMVRRECDVKGFQFEHDYIADLNMYAELMTRLLKEIDIVRLGPERLELNSRSVLFLRDVLAPAIRFAQPLLQQRGLSKDHIRYYSFDKIPNLFLDPSLMTQVTFNVIHNAIKYYNGPPDSFSLRISAQRNRASYEVVFADNGIGVPQEARERIFERGFRHTGASATTVTGSGIGLWLARELLLRHGGDLLLKSPQNPTKFAILLPMELAHSHPE